MVMNPPASAQFWLKKVKEMYWVKEWREKRQKTQKKLLIQLLFTLSELKTSIYFYETIQVKNKAIGYARGSQTFQPVTLKITVPVTRDFGNHWVMQCYHHLKTGPFK